MNIGKLAQPKPILYILFCIIYAFFSACAKKEVPPKQDIKTQVKTNQPSIPFATNKAESNKWYKEQFLPILKQSSSKKGSRRIRAVCKALFCRFKSNTRL